MDIKLVSLFSGAGGLDLGFSKAGFSTIWANEYDCSIWDTFRLNFPKVFLDRRNLILVDTKDIPDCDGIIGCPPHICWGDSSCSTIEEGKCRRVFTEYVKVIREKQPKFFVAENISRMLLPRNIRTFNAYMDDFRRAGYNIVWKIVDANEYDVPQTRTRIVIVGYRRDLNKSFTFPPPVDTMPVLKDAIFDMPLAKPARSRNRSNGKDVNIANHEYMLGEFSASYMSRNRVKAWHEPSFTIPPRASRVPLHPKAPKMWFVSANKRIFVPGCENVYRRLSVRECARIQTFPDDFVFIYKNIIDGYRMVGDAFPVNLAYHIAKQIKKEIFE